MLIKVANLSTIIFLLECIFAFLFNVVRAFWNWVCSI